MNTLTVISENGIKRYVLDDDKKPIERVRLINGTVYTTHELVSLVAPKVVE